MFCGHCGAESGSGESFCRACGSSLAPAPSALDKPTSVTSMPRRSVSSVQNEVPTIDPSSSSRGRSNGRTDSTVGPGQPFGTRYHIIRELGRGGMGVVYQAWDQELGIAVALKIIRPDQEADPDVERERELRFKRELVLARQVTHKNVVRIHDLGEIDGIKYLTMPFIQGESLAARVRRQGKLPVERALHLAKQVAAGLAAAHEAGVVHRDLKPANIMIDEDEQAVVLDFGLARSTSGMTMGTATGAVMGTFQYMAPEQASGSRVDQRADIYAFGLIVQEMLLGVAPASESPMAAVVRRMHEAAPSLHAIDPAIPEPVDRIVQRCLQPDPDARYQTAAELAEDLGKLDASGHSSGVRLPALQRRRWLLPGVAVAGVVLLAVVASLWVWVARTPAAPVAREPVSVLIANFDNKAGDPVFDGALEQALSIAIEGASFITAYPRANAARVLSAVSNGARLDEAGARLVARREGIKVVLSGEITGKDAYTIAVRVLDPTSDKPSTTVRASSLGKGEVLGAIGALAGRIRATLGETANAAGRQNAAETFTAGSLAAMREYALGQDLLAGRKDKEAIEHYRQAVRYDARFGRAYAGWAVAARTIGKGAEADEQWQKAVALMDRMTEREKYRTLGGYYLLVTRDYEKAIENFETLVRLYPADTAGHSNLALSYFYVLNFPKAFDEGRRAIALWPNMMRFRSNYALYAMYAGDFATAAKESEALIQQAPGSYDLYLPLAIAQAAGGNVEAARATYARMAATDQTGQSTAATGLADLALYQGRVADARTLLEKALPGDEQGGITAGVISKRAALAEAALLAGDNRGAAAAADALVAMGHQEETLVPASRVYLAVGKDTVARQFADELQKKVPPKTRAYGKIIEGMIALKQGRRAEAIDAFRAAQKLADIWLARFDLGVAYVENGLYAEALSEFEKCEKRRGEATAIFLDDWPTFRYLAPLSYWFGRAKEGLKMNAAAAEHYRQFLALRPEGPKDPEAIDARARVSKL